MNYYYRHLTIGKVSNANFVVTVCLKVTITRVTFVNVLIVELVFRNIVYVCVSKYDEIQGYKKCIGTLCQANYIYVFMLTPKLYEPATAMGGGNNGARTTFFRLLL